MTRDEAIAKLNTIRADGRDILYLLDCLAALGLLKLDEPTALPFSPLARLENTMRHQGVPDGAIFQMEVALSRAGLKVVEK